MAKDEKVVKFQFELTEDRLKEIEALMRESGVATKKEFINNALTLLMWAIEESKSGNMIAAVDEENKNVRVLLMPILRAVSKKE